LSPFSDLNVSQGSLAMPLRYGGIFNNNIIEIYLLTYLSAQDFWKSVSIWQSYGQNSSVLIFFWLTV